MGIGYVDIYNGIIIAHGYHDLERQRYTFFTFAFLSHLHDIIRGRCLHKINKHNSTSRIYVSFSLPRSDFNNILHHRPDIYLKEGLIENCLPLVEFRGCQI